MKAIVACGGTGGHAFPGLAVADELLRRGHDVCVWNAGRDVEASVMKGWQGPSFATGARQIRLRNALSLVASILRCRRAMRAAKPDVLLAMGSYSSLPPVLAAHGCGVPVVLHEANTVPGKAVDLLSRFAAAVATSFEMTASMLPRAKTFLSGLPVRSGIAAGKRFDFIPAGAFTVFVTGGSQGAHALNELMSAALVEAGREIARRGGGRTLYVIHQTGVRDEAAVRQAYAAAGVPARVKAFEDSMADAFASADFVVSRAGASTCFELAACGKPALLVPLPTALRDHQRYNAEAFSASGAADVGLQSVLSVRQAARYILRKFETPGKLACMAAAMRNLAAPDAAAKVASLVEKAAAGELT